MIGTTSKRRIFHIALSSFYGYHVHQIPLNISKAQIKFYNFCRNEDIRRTHPDTSNGVVIHNRSENTYKVHAIGIFELNVASWVTRTLPCSI